MKRNLRNKAICLAGVFLFSATSMSYAAERASLLAKGEHICKTQDGATSHCGVEGRFPSCDEAWFVLEMKSCCAEAVVCSPTPANHYCKAGVHSAGFIQGACGEGDQVATTAERQR